MPVTVKLVPPSGGLQPDEPVLALKSSAKESVTGKPLKVTRFFD
jgi:hypothetical protein